MVDYRFGYFAREVVGDDGNGPSHRTIFKAFFTNGPHLIRNLGDVLGRPATLTLIASTSATGAALLTSGSSTRWCHQDGVSAFGWWRGLGVWKKVALGGGKEKEGGRETEELLSLHVFVPFFSPLD